VFQGQELAVGARHLVHFVRGLAFPEGLGSADCWNNVLVRGIVPICSRKSNSTEGGGNYGCGSLYRVQI
jgi:hypothetical protein